MSKNWSGLYMTVKRESESLGSVMEGEKGRERGKWRDLYVFVSML